MYCENCGAKLSSKDKFCKNCGASVVTSNEEVKEIKEEKVVEKAESLKKEAKKIVDTNTPKKKKTLKILICLLVVALIAGGALAYYNFIYKTPVKAFSKVIDQFTDGIIDNLDDETVSEKGSIKLSAKVKTSSTESSMMEIVDLLADTDFDIKYELDRDNKIFNFDMNVNYEGRKFVGVDATIDEYNAYFRLDDAQKYIKSTIPEGQNIFEMFKSMDDTKEIINGIAKALKCSLKNKYFEKESDEITIDGDDVKVTKYTLTLNKENLVDILSDVIDNINDDEDLLKALTKTTDMDKESLKATLQMVKANMLSSAIEEFPVIKINIYTKGFNDDAVRYEFEVAGQKISITKVDDETYTFAIMGINLGELKVEEKDNEKDVTLTIGYMGEKVIISAKSKRETNVKVKEKDTYGAISVENVPDNYFDPVMKKITNHKLYKAIYNMMNPTYYSYSDDYYLYD